MNCSSAAPERTARCWVGDPPREVGNILQGPRGQISGAELRPDFSLTGMQSYGKVIQKG